MINFIIVEKVLKFCACKCSPKVRVEALENSYIPDNITEEFADLICLDCFQRRAKEPILSKLTQTTFPYTLFSILFIIYVMKIVSEMLQKDGLAMMQIAGMEAAKQ